MLHEAYTLSLCCAVATAAPTVASLPPPPIPRQHSQRKNTYSRVDWSMHVWQGKIMARFLYQDRDLEVGQHPQQLLRHLSHTSCCHTTTPGPPSCSSCCGCCLACHPSSSFSPGAGPPPGPATVPIHLLQQNGLGSVSARNTNLILVWKPHHTRWIINIWVFLLVSHPVVPMWIVQLGRTKFDSCLRYWSLQHVLHSSSVYYNTTIIVKWL